MADPVGTITSTLGGGISSLSGYLWVILVILGLGIIGTIIYFVATFFKNKDKWNLTFRVYQENNQHETLYLDPVIIRAKRVTLSNGLRLMYLEKAILGKKLFPLLNFYTKPGVYDLVVTSDNRIFIITGISGINEQRKELKVGIRYPGIDYAMEEVNRDHSKLNQLDRRNDMLGMVKAAATALIAIIILVIFIIGGKYYMEAKTIDAQISESELALFENLQEYQVNQVEQSNAMLLVTENLKQIMGTNNLKRELDVIKES